MSSNVHPVFKPILDSFSACPIGRQPAADDRLIAAIKAAPTAEPRTTSFIGNEMVNRPIGPDRWRDACHVEACMDGYFHVLAPDRRQFLSHGGWRVGTGKPIDRIVGNFLSKDRAVAALALADKYLPGDEVARQAMVFHARLSGDTEQRSQQRHLPHPSV